MTLGNKPTDGGFLMMSAEEKSSLLRSEPNSAKFVRRLVGSQEFIKGLERWCLWVADHEIAEAMSIPFIRARIEAVRNFRLSRDGKQAHDGAKKPHRFVYAPHRETHAIVVPSIASERREHQIAGIVDAGTIVNNKAYAIYGGNLYLFSVISSRLHFLWNATVSGRMRQDFSYSNQLVYNTFPIAPLTEKQQDLLEEYAWSIIAARDLHPGKTIAWLYDPDTMPKDLLDVHRSLDDTLEKIYIGRPFKNDAERLEHLFKLYAEMTSGMHKEAANA